jgi:hypothetical protein
MASRNPKGKTDPISSPSTNPLHRLSSSGPRRSEDDAVVPTRTEPVVKSPLEVFEGAILKERQGSLSEAVIQYRRAFKVCPLLQRQRG